MSSLYQGGFGRRTMVRDFSGANMSMVSRKTLSYLSTSSNSRGRSLASASRPHEMIILLKDSKSKFLSRRLRTDFRSLSGIWKFSWKQRALWSEINCCITTSSLTFKASASFLDMTRSKIWPLLYYGWEQPHVVSGLTYLSAVSSMWKLKSQMMSSSSEQTTTSSNKLENSSKNNPIAAPDSGGRYTTSDRFTIWTRSWTSDVFDGCGKITAKFHK